MLRPRPLAITVAVITCLIALVSFWSVRAYYNDDAFISLRYAHNLLAGHGLVWNPGEAVEGYSNFLFVLLVALLGWLRFDLVLATKLIGVLSYLCLIGGAGLYVRNDLSPVSDRSTVPLLSLGLLACSPCLIAWSLGGLETVLFATFIAGGTVLAVRSMDTTRAPEDHRRQGRALILTSLLFALANLTRFEGLLFFGLAAAVVLYTKRNDSDRRHSWLSLLLPYAVLVGAHLIFRLYYYGALVPNTWHVKGLFGWDRLWLGCLYLFDFALAPPYPMLFVFATALACLRMRKWNRQLSLLLLLMLACAVIAVYAGGDHMPAFRLCAPIVPLASLFLYSVLREVLPSWRRVLHYSLSGVVVAACAMTLIAPGLGYRYARTTDDAAYVGRIVGEYISTHWRSGSLIALNSAGATPYYAPNQRFIDMLGLNDRTIARRSDPPFVSSYQLVPGHAKGDGRYVFSRRPDYIIAGPTNGCEIYRALTLSEYELARINEFRDQYKLSQDSIPAITYPGYREFEDTKSGWLLFTYYRRLPVK